MRLGDAGYCTGTDYLRKGKKYSGYADGIMEVVSTLKGWGMK